MKTMEAQVCRLLKTLSPHAKRGSVWYARPAASEGFVNLYGCRRGEDGRLHWLGLMINSVHRTDIELADSPAVSLCY